MVSSSLEADEVFVIPMNIYKMEKAIQDLPWYSFIKRWKLQAELAEMRSIGARIGFIKAMKDLEEIGLIKRVK